MRNIITSSQNERIKKLERLKKPRERKKTGRFLIEGYREISRALMGNYVLEELYFSPELFLRKENEDLLAKKIAQQKGVLTQLAPALFAKLSYRDRPDGLLAVATQKKTLVEQISLSQEPLVLLAERIEKPGNLGTILRSSDAAGVDAVLVTDPVTDIYNPNVVRSSVGCLFTQTVVQIEQTRALSYLQEHKIRTLAATPYGEDLFTEVDLSGPIAILVGSEQYGLKEESLASADLRVRIPMFGEADSLNVAQATTLLLYEAVRQRHRLS
ncbi:MAG: RNA methyltransferase [Chlamydiota bacterium]